MTAAGIRAGAGRGQMPGVSWRSSPAAGGRGRAVVRLLFRCGLLGLAHRLWPRRLTVLAYHRIADPHAPDFKGLVANVSATPDQFAAQLDLLSRWCNVVSLDLVLEWLAGRAELPSYPALITFDDGYRDNYDEALPALRARDMPAVLFLATACVGSLQPFFWDLAAYCFATTRKREAELPLLGHRTWPDRAARDQVLQDWLAQAKQRHVDEVAWLVEALRKALGVEVPADAFAAHHVGWEEVRRLARAGVAVEAHTHAHAILSRVPPERAREEVRRSRAAIEATLGSQVRAFAYPNGTAQDYRAEDVAMLRREGFAAAFVLTDGPTGLRAVRRRPLEIRRILVTHQDDLTSFAAAVAGLTRLVRWARRARPNLSIRSTRQQAIRLD